MHRNLLQRPCEQKEDEEKEQDHEAIGVLFAPAHLRLFAVFAGTTFRSGFG